nr:hypothetical protein [Nitrosomonas nitrosa]
MQAIDRTITRISLALIALFPTLLAVLLRPSQLRCRLNLDRNDDQSKFLLAPGPFFLLGMLSALIGASFMADRASGAVIAIGEEVAVAARAGQFWQIASVALPLFITAIVFGLVNFLVAQGWQLNTRSLASNLRAAQYGLLGILTIVFVAEPVSNLFGSGGNNMVFEPVVYVMVGAWIAWFHLGLLSSSKDAVWRRLGSAVSISLISSGFLSILYI